VRPEAQYLEFSMAASVQGWRQKWFYIKDRKSSPEDEFGLPPFDASQEVKKLASWDTLPLDAEVEQILPLLSRIQALTVGTLGPKQKSHRIHDSNAQSPHGRVHYSPSHGGEQGDVGEGGEVADCGPHSNLPLVTNSSLCFMFFMFLHRLLLGTLKDALK
jgi:hypothetical protein